MQHSQGREERRERDMASGREEERSDPLLEQFKGMAGIENVNVGGENSMVLIVDQRISAVMIAPGDATPGTIHDHRLVETRRCRRFSMK
jgi:hypothetical protein